MAARQQAFGGDRLLECLAAFPRTQRYRVGFSGGADSTALLLALHEARDRVAADVRAIHFHHGLQDSADDWAAHCREFCRIRDIPLDVERLDIRSAPRGSPEEWARDARYRRVAELLQDDEMYLTAHHAGDLAETLFLNLMRGSGIEGLAGIPPLRNLGRGTVGRPLLDVEPADLLAYLRQRRVRWLEDPSNRDSSFDRNFLRQELFPLLDRRWPGVTRRLARTARHARQSASAMAAFIERQSGEALEDPIRLPVGALMRLQPEIQSLVLRQWLRRNEIPALPTARLTEFLQQLAGARSGSHAEVRWAGWMIKRYRGELWLHRTLPGLACRETRWQNTGRVDLGPESGTLALTAADVRPPEGWRVGPRESGSRIRLAPDGPSRTLKHCFQACGVPPWLRAGVPVLYWDDEPAAVGDWLIADRLDRWLTANDVGLAWRPLEAVLARIRADCQNTRL